MKYLLHICLFLVLIQASSNTNAQVTRLSNNTNLETAIPLGTIAVLISESDSLWKTDGTIGGTLKYATHVAVDSPYRYTIFANKIYFTGIDADGEELWVTDGTTAGTQLVKNINPGAASSSPDFFVVFNNALYFFADDGVNGKELWKSDGTSGGTAMLKNINPTGSSITTSSTYIIHNGELFFTATDGTTGTELWKTDGTPGGTVQVKDINLGPASSNPLGFFVYGTIVLFIADNGSTGGELWKTDGTESNTELVKDIAAGPFGSFPTGFTFFNNKVYFDAFDFTNGFEGWMTDGTTANTTLLKDINPSFESGLPLFINSLFLNNKMYFPATTMDEGTELWWSDGTGPNTLLFKDINSGAEGSDPILFLNFFNATDINSFHSSLFNGILFLEAKRTGEGTELWKTDGTTGGTVIVKDINPGADSSLNDSSTYFYTSSNLYFSATNGANGYELWKSDGTAPNTNLVFDINPGYAGSYPTFIAYFNNIVLFTATDGDNANDRDLFRLDGSFSPLPLNLLQFAGTVYDKAVQLSWLTASEINTDHFMVEKSNDGNSFEAIGKVKALRNTVEKKEYAFTDPDAMKPVGKKVFYRLKMVDNDGKFAYSKVIALSRLSAQNLVAFPNPAREGLNITINSTTRKQIVLRIVDASGNLVFSRNMTVLKGQQNYAINVASFAKGVYYINVVSNEGTETTRFIKE